jgi:hypothetical protein
MKNLCYFLTGFIAGVIITGIITLTIIDRHVETLSERFLYMEEQIDYTLNSVNYFNGQLSNAMNDMSSLGLAWVDLRQAIRDEWVGIVNTRVVK